jgi:hypothetical protein
MSMAVAAGPTSGTPSSLRLPSIRASPGSHCFAPQLSAPRGWTPRAPIAPNQCLLRRVAASVGGARHPRGTGTDTIPVNYSALNISIRSGVAAATNPNRYIPFSALGLHPHPHQVVGAPHDMSAMMGYHHHLLPYLPALAEIWKREAGNGHPASVLLRRQSRDGEWRWVRVRASRNSWCSRLALTSGGRINRGEERAEENRGGGEPSRGVVPISSRPVWSRGRHGGGGGACGRHSRRPGARPLGARPALVSVSLPLSCGPDGGKRQDTRDGNGNGIEHIKKYNQWHRAEVLISNSIEHMRCISMAHKKLSQN